MENKILTNLRLDEEKLGKIKAAGDENDPVLFAILGEIDARGRYGNYALLATARKFVTYDFTEDIYGEPVLFDDIDEIYNKRMYGNGLMRAKMKDGRLLNIFRFNFTVTALCDAAVIFAQDLAKGEPFEDVYGAIQSSYDKMLSVCPKCGRTLSSPGVECVNCMDKSKLVKKLGGYLKPEIKVLIVTVVLSVITTALALVPPKLTANLVDDILPNGKLDSLGIVVVMLVVLQFVMHAIGCVRGYMLRLSGNKIMARIKNDVYEKAQHLPMRFYDKTSTGSVINRISGDTDNLKNYMLRVTQEVVVQFFKLIGIIVIMLLTNWKLTLFSLIPVPIVVIGSRIFREKMAPFYRRIWRRSSGVTSVLTDTIPGIRVIKSFTNEQNSTERFSSCVEEWRQTDNSAGKILSVYPAVINCLIGWGSIVIWALGGRMVINSGSITPGVLVSFISYASMFYEPVNFFANFSDSTQSALSSAERLMDILDAEPEHDFGKGNCDADMGGRIEFKHVSFSFDRTKKVLRDINLVIEPGEVVGIVGTTGSGKSTLINLLLRYYDHYEGTITVGGVDIRDIDMNYYRSKIGYVQQEPMMFHDTIYNNIAYGDNGTFTVDEVINAADIANAHEFIVRQPDGYDSVLGERGTGVSGGERQRISIARAMLRNPKMLVFDEATASVDSETEHLIQEAIEHLITGRTTIMIAHRLSTLSKATKIVVVDNGQILECGSPQELMAMKGKYYRLVEIQSMSDKVAESKRNENFE